MVVIGIFVVLILLAGPWALAVWIGTRVRWPLLALVIAWALT